MAWLFTSVALPTAPSPSAVAGGFFLHTVHVLLPPPPPPPYTFLPVHLPGTAAAIRYHLMPCFLPVVAVGLWTLVGMVGPAILFCRYHLPTTTLLPDFGPTLLPRPRFILRPHHSRYLPRFPRIYPYPFHLHHPPAYCCCLPHATPTTPHAFNNAAARRTARSRWFFVGPHLDGITNRLPRHSRSGQVGRRTTPPAPTALTTTAHA